MATRRSSPSPTPIIYIVEDDAAMRKSIGALVESIGMEARAFANGNEFLEEFANHDPGCLVLDMRLPNYSGLQLMRKIKRRYEYCPPTIIITAHGDVTTAVEAMKSGVVDFLEKPFAPQRFLDLIHQANEIDKVNRKKLAQHQELREALDSISDREQQVLDGLLQGKPNKLIASELGLSNKTVASHRANIQTKLGTSSLVDLVRLIEDIT